MPIGIKGFQSGGIPWNKGKICPQFSGKNNPMYGKHHTNEAKAKIGWASLGERNPAKRQEVREKIRQTLLNHPVSEETKKKLKEFHKGKHYSLKTEFKKGNRVSELIKRKISKSLQGDKHWNWQGGKSFEPYGLEFNEDLKEVIRNRDGRKCFICEKTELENEKKLMVHHIDYNKNNNNPDNLITLCLSCHSKTSFDRDYWIGYFKRYE